MELAWAITPGEHPVADSFGLITGVAIDRAGNVYVSDRLAAKVWVFDGDGSGLGSIGRKGEGPGEFQAPTGPGIGPDGLLYVRDVYRVSRFGADSTGVLSELDHTFEGPTYAHWTSLRATRFDTAGRLYYPGYRFGEDARIRPFVVRFSPDGALLDTLHVPPEPTSPARIPFVRVGSTGGRMLPGLEHVPFAPLPAWDVTPEGTLVSGSSAEYRLRETGAAGEELRTFERAVAPEAIPAAERADSVRALEERLDSVPVPLDDVVGLTDDVRNRALPTSYPLYSAVYVGEDGRLWVRRWLAESTHRTVFDLFDRDGSFRTTVVLPELVLVEPTPVLSLDAVTAVIRRPLTGEDGLVRFVPAGE